MTDSPSPNPSPGRRQSLPEPPASDGAPLPPKVLLGLVLTFLALPLLLIILALTWVTLSRSTNVPRTQPPSPPAASSPDL